MIPLELTLSKIAENLQRASRMLRTPVWYTVSPKEKSEARNTNTKWTKFCKNYFLGKGFCKTSANVFEIRRGLEFRPRGGGVWGGIRAGFLLVLAERAKIKISLLYLLPFPKEKFFCS